MKRIGALALALVGVLAAIVSVRTAVFRSHQLHPEPVAIEVDAHAAAAHLAEAVRLPTVSVQGRAASRETDAAFAELHALFERTYPRVHATLTREVIGRGVLYTWRGSSPQLEPVLLLAHLDVVPVAPGTEGDWIHPPFSGALAEGHVWGRGTLDDKQNAVGALEAFEHLLEAGFTPERTVLLALGHDEEIGGTEGAVRIRERLQERGVRAHLVLDEGAAIVEDVDGVEAPVAFVGIAEKGYATVRLTARSAGGHSSMPPDHSAAGRIGAAVAALEANPMPARLDGPIGVQFDHMGPESVLARRVVFANRWLLGGVLKRILAGDAATNAMIRTTTAVTMLEGSPKENVLPTSATAHVNFRIRPGDSTADVLDHVRGLVDGLDIEVEEAGDLASEPSPVSPVDGVPFAQIATTIRQVFPDVVVSPFLVLGATDARHFTPISDHVYRFSAVTLTRADLARIHGTNERVSVESMGRIVTFYVQFVKNTCGS